MLLSGMAAASALDDAVCLASEEAITPPKGSEKTDDVKVYGAAVCKDQAARCEAGTVAETSKLIQPSAMFYGQAEIRKGNVLRERKILRP